MHSKKKKEKEFFAAIELYEMADLPNQPYRNSIFLLTVILGELIVILWRDASLYT